MPELPEVETICRGIGQNILGKKIALVKTSNKSLRLPFPKNLFDLQQQKIIFVSRRARYILIKVSGQQILLIHLGMSGKLLFFKKTPEKFINEDLASHNHFLIIFGDQSCLIYNDPRRFGLIDLVNENKIYQHLMLKNLGVEPLSKDFNKEYLQQKLKGKKINIKTIMMDNKIVVGIGNIYINESLFVSKILPSKMAGDLNLLEIELLVKNTKIILEKAINSGGSTLRDYAKLDGDVGSFQLDFKVYGREGEDCFICASKIKRIKQNGRSSFYCKICQT
jgi:formamidopyrimidine-DNA glycosylase